MTRVTRTQAPGPATTAEISAARGETESFQVAVHAGDQRLTGGDFVVSDLVGPGGSTIGQARITRYCKHFARVRRHSPRESGAVVEQRWFPDALLPFVDPVTGGAPDPRAEHAAAPYVVPPAATDWTRWTQDPATLASVREALAGALT